MRKGFTLFEVIVVVIILGIISYVSMVSLLPVRQGSLFIQAQDSEHVIGRVILELRMAGITVSSGKYTPAQFLNEYHMEIPPDPLSYPLQGNNTVWYIDGTKIYPVHYDGTVVNTISLHGQTYTAYYDIASDYPILMEDTHFSAEPPDNVTENYSHMGQNLVRNGSFSQGLLYWKWYNGKPTLSIVDTPKNGNVNYCVRMNGNTSESFGMYQDIRISGHAGDAFRISYKAKPVNMSEAGWYGCEVFIHYTDGHYAYQGQWHPNMYESKWQSGTVTVKADKDYDYIRVYLLLYKTDGYTLYDDIFITKIGGM